MYYRITPREYSGGPGERGREMRGCMEDALSAIVAAAS